MSYELLIYLFGYFVYGLYLLETGDLNDVVASLVVALIWPVHLCARILRAVI